MRTFGEAPPPPTFFDRLKSGLSKTGLGEILTKKKLDAAAVAELEEALIRADMGAAHDQVVAASKLVPDDIVQMITASGEPDEVREKVGEYVANGCTCPILYPLGDDVRLMIDTFAGGL